MLEYERILQEDETEMDTQGHETATMKKEYHAPELTFLGPIRSVVNGNPSGVPCDGSGMVGMSMTTAS